MNHLLVAECKETMEQLIFEMKKNINISHAYFDGDSARVLAELRKSQLSELESVYKDFIKIY